MKNTIITKKNTSAKKAKDYFSFALGLSQHLFSDYLSLRLSYYIEPIALMPTYLVKMIEVAEKSFKVFLSMKEKQENALSIIIKTYGHNIEKMRDHSEQYCKKFADNDIKEFTCQFNDKRGNFYQLLRYGSHETIDGYSAQVSQMLFVVDKIFFNCVCFGLDYKERHIVNTHSSLFNLINKTQFDSSKNRLALLPHSGSVSRFNNRRNGLWKKQFGCLMI